MNGQTLTYGQIAVGISFNPSGDPKVQEIKELYAKIIDLCNDFKSSAIAEGQPNSNERNRLLSIAITEAQGAQMWAVKGITCKY